MSSTLMAEAHHKSPSQLLLTILRGSWRPASTRLEWSAEELNEVMPLLPRSGVAALCWRRLERSGLADSPNGRLLHDTYRFNTLHAARTQQTITHVLAHLRTFGIEAILVKGWAAAGLYPDEGLRPYGDIDLCVRQDQFESAQAALNALPERRYEVDLHAGFERLGGGKEDEIYRRSLLVRLGDADVRVPSLEDHLRILCIHFLREGGWRPLWLCDIAAAVESVPTGFDWTYCLGRDRRQADSIVCAIRVAHEILGADISGTPAVEKRTELPRWLIPTILKEWDSPSPSMSLRHRAPISSYFRNPSKLFQGLHDRWPNPIEATISVGGPFNDFPRFPFQVGNCLARTARFIARVPGFLREQ